LVSTPIHEFGEITYTVLRHTYCAISPTEQICMTAFYMAKIYENKIVTLLKLKMRELV